MSETPPPDFKILRDGTWFHDGAEIKRAALAKLFSDKALIIDEGGKYWLKTPFEQYAVAVEDVPFVVIDYEASDDSVTFKTNMQETVALEEGANWELRGGVPYIEVRKGLFARIGRSVYYNLVEQFGSDVKGFPLG